MYVYYTYNENVLLYLCIRVRKIMYNFIRIQDKNLSQKNHKGYAFRIKVLLLLLLTI